MPIFDPEQEFGKRVAKRLREEQVIWLTTVRPDGQPLPVPVWFLWDGDEELLMFSQPNTPKLRHIEQNPHVSLNFNTDAFGNDVMRFQANARVESDHPAAVETPAMIEKYREGIERLGTTPEGFSENFSVPVRMRLTKLWGF